MHDDFSPHKGRQVRVRRPSRRFRLWLAFGLGIAYLSGLALLLSPLWSGGAVESATTPPVKPVQGIKTLGTRSLGSVDVVPSRLPGTLIGETGVGGEGALGSEATQVEGGSEAGAPEGAESSEAGGGGSKGKSVIGFEG